MSGSARGTRRQVPTGTLGTAEPERPAGVTGASDGPAGGSRDVECGSTAGGATVRGVSVTGREPGTRRTVRQRRKPFVL